MVGSLRGLQWFATVLLASGWEDSREVTVDAHGTVQKADLPAHRSHFHRRTKTANRGLDGRLRQVSSALVEEAEDQGASAWVDEAAGSEWPTFQEMAKKYLFKHETGEFSLPAAIEALRVDGHGPPLLSHFAALVKQKALRYDAASLSDFFQRRSCIEHGGDAAACGSPLTPEDGVEQENLRNRFEVQATFRPKLVRAPGPPVLSRDTYKGNSVVYLGMQRVLACGTLGMKDEPFRRIATAVMQGPGGAAAGSLYVDATASETNIWYGGLRAEDAACSGIDFAGLSPGSPDCGLWITSVPCDTFFANPAPGARDADWVGGRAEARQSLNEDQLVSQMFARPFGTKDTAAEVEHRNMLDRCFHQPEEEVVSPCPGLDDHVAISALHRCSFGDGRIADVVGWYSLGPHALKLDQGGNLFYEGHGMNGPVFEQVQAVVQSGSGLQMRTVAGSELTVRWPEDRERVQDVVKLLSQQKVAVYILGPSGSGKTFSTQSNLDKVLRANRLDPLRCYLAVDAGVLRERGVGRVWTEMAKLKDFFQKLDAGLRGFEDAYTKYAKEYSGAFKSALVGKMLQQPHAFSLLVPDVVVGGAADYVKTLVPGVRSHGKTKDQYDQLASAGFTIVITAINTDQANTAAQAISREAQEGKKYQSVSWEPSIEATKDIMDWAHRQRGNGCWFYIQDNNNYERLCGMSNTRCRPNWGAWIAAGAKVELTTDGGCLMGSTCAAHYGCSSSRRELNYVCECTEPNGVCS